MSGAIKGIGKIFGGGGSGSGQQSQLFDMLRQQQEQAALRDAQGRQLALLSKDQAESDNEIAALRKPGLGRALLAYRKDRDGAATLGG
jgi:hypothetical protein